MNAVSSASAEKQGTVTPTEAHLAAVNAGLKWERRWRVIKALEAYKLRIDARADLRDRYEALCARLYSSRSSRITGMPVNHDQFTAGDRFAKMLDEKMELERALACRQEIVMRLKCIGFEYVTLDLEGYRSGSLNEVL